MRAHLAVHTTRWNGESPLLIYSNESSLEPPQNTSLQNKVIFFYANAARGRVHENTYYCLQGEKFCNAWQILLCISGGLDICVESALHQRLKFSRIEQLVQSTFLSVTLSLHLIRYTAKCPTWFLIAGSLNV